MQSAAIERWASRASESSGNAATGAKRAAAAEGSRSSQEEHRRGKLAPQGHSVGKGSWRGRFRSRGLWLGVGLGCEVGGSITARFTPTGLSGLELDVARCLEIRPELRYTLHSRPAGELASVMRPGQIEGFAAIRGFFLLWHQRGRFSSQGVICNRTVVSDAGVCFVGWFCKPREPPRIRCTQPRHRAG